MDIEPQSIEVESLNIVVRDAHGQVDMGATQDKFIKMN